MSDLNWAIAIMGMVSAAAFELPRRITRPWGRSALLATLSSACAGLVAFLWWVFDSQWMIRLLPLKNLMVFGNWTPVLAGVIGGVAWNARFAGPAWRRGVLTALLMGVSCYAAWGPVYTKRVKVDPSQQATLWRQTSDASCSAAAAATLLNHFGIPATEAEMTELCLTSDRGTTNWGLYRGLRIKTEGTPYSVETVSGGADGVLACVGPVLVSSGIDKWQTADPEYETRGGWIRGVRHSVVSLGRDAAGRVAVSDPSTGTEAWSDDSFRTLFRGVAFALRDNGAVTQGIGLLNP